MPLNVRGILRKIAPRVILMLSLAVAARADVIYNFDYTAESGPISSTTFQLDEPTFLSAGYYSIAPSLSILLGAADYSFTQLYVGTQDGDAVCFSIATAPPANVGNCTAGTSGAGEAYFFGGFPAANIPSTPGTFGGVDAGAAFIAMPDNSAEVGSGFLVLDITETPEPRTAPLVGAALLAALAVIAVRRPSYGEPVSSFTPNRR